MSNKTKKNLGRGLSALLDAADVGPKSQKQSSEEDKNKSVLVPIEQVSPGKLQPRQAFGETDIKELANSIEQHGILQPILVRSFSDKKDHYEIVAGERRWRAAQRAKLHRVPVLVRDFSDVEALEVGLIENLQRENLDPLEEAEGYIRLMREFKHTQDQVAKALGKSRPYVANLVRLLSLPEPVKDMLRSFDITVGHARALLSCEKPIEAAKIIKTKRLNVRQTEQLVRNIKTNKLNTKAKKRSFKKNKDVNILSLEKNLTNQLGLKVSIDFDGRGGSLKILYENLDQLDGILYSLSQGKYGRT